MNIFSFPAIENTDSKILILGTMPGKISLQKNEYYANPQNAFWKIIFSLFAIDYQSNYETKKQVVIQNKIALWDTLKFCHREGSLDSKIMNEYPNDFFKFFEFHSKISTIVFNGKPAQHFYKRHIGFSNRFNYISLPSTSPANARMSFEKKLELWKIILEYL